MSYYNKDHWPITILDDDISPSNIFIDNDKVIFIDYGDALDYPGNDRLLIFMLNEIDEDNNDLMLCSSMFQDDFDEMKFEDRLLIIKINAVLIKHQLNTLFAWQRIYQSFFKQHLRIPGPNDLYDIVYGILSGSVLD